MEKKFKVCYDDNVMDVIDTISHNLKDFGVYIEEYGDGGDGWIEYIIKKL